MQYLAEHHMKVTGLKLIKRDTTLLSRMVYLKSIEHVLNQKQFRDPDKAAIGFQVISEITRYEPKVFVSKHKMNQTQLNGPFSQLAEVHRFGLGDNVFTYYRVPANVKNQFRHFKPSDVSLGSLMSVYRVNDEII